MWNDMTSHKFPSAYKSVLYCWCGSLRYGSCYTCVSWYLLKFGGCKSVSHIVIKWFPAVLSIESSRFVQRCLLYNHISMIWELGVFTPMACRSKQAAISMTIGLDYLMTSLICIKNIMSENPASKYLEPLCEALFHIYGEKNAIESAKCILCGCPFSRYDFITNYFKTRNQKGCLYVSSISLHRSCNTWISCQFRLPTLENHKNNHQHGLKHNKK